MTERKIIMSFTEKFGKVMNDLDKAEESLTNLGKNIGKELKELFGSKSE